MVCGDFVEVGCRRCVVFVCMDLLCAYVVCSVYEGYVWHLWHMAYVRRVWNRRCIWWTCAMYYSVWDMCMWRMLCASDVFMACMCDAWVYAM